MTKPTRKLAWLAVVMCTLAGVVGATGSGTSNNGPREVRDPRVVIHKSARRLFLFDGSELVRSYPIDIGLQPTGQKQVGSDRRTPEGRFHIEAKNRSSPYHKFLGLDYPDESAIAFGLASGLISAGEAGALRAAHARGECPSWTTALGGGIGIHGHRTGQDWTGGCVALSDENVDELFRVMRVGDPVEILP